ncbi:MAG: DUF1592 domain-containing protein [Planctomycetaceae bacterium]
MDGPRIHYLIVVTMLALLVPTMSLGADRPKGVDVAAIDQFVQNHCVSCHGESEPERGLDLESQSFAATDWKNDAAHAKWETVFKRVRSRQMPPPDSDRPDEETYTRVESHLAKALDELADATLSVPHVDSLRRLTRTEYQNSIRDLLHVDVDAKQWIPKDESSQGFDNITLGTLSPVLMNRYVTAAEKISRLAVGRKTGVPVGLTVRLPPDLTQEQHLTGLPLGTRGGTNIKHTFAESGAYEIAVRLTRDRDEKVEGLNGTHQLDVLVDLSRKHRFRIERSKDRKDYSQVDANLNVRFHIDAGPREIAVTFVDKGFALREIKRKPFDAAYNRHRHPRQQPALYEVSIVGPLEDDAGKTKKQASQTPAVSIATPSRDAIFTAKPTDGSQAAQTLAAKAIFRPLLRRAYRRAIDEAGLALPMNFFRDAIEPTTVTSSEATITNTSKPVWRQTFEYGIERGIASILVNPNFLFRIERTSKAKGLQPITDTELASRLSFFLWSSGPDDDLLDLAESRRLNDPKVLNAQVDRMLADKRSDSLVTNFASQWLYLRNLGNVKPDLRAFPDFDENLRRAFRMETESFVRNVFQSDASVMNLIQSDFTFLNDRLAVHYDIPGIVGSDFRRVTVPKDSHRGGLLRHGSILSVTSYATRTSPSIRGNWVLENIVGTPAPPPPPNVPTLKEKSAIVAATFRERLAQHREDPTCASCHNLMDPVGFALDSFDAVGRWRTFDLDDPIDSGGTLPDGTEVSSVEDLEQSLISRPEMFVSCLVEKLMTFGLGRGTDHRDASAIRKIVSNAKTRNFRFSDLIRGIINSRPFKFRSEYNAAANTPVNGAAHD